MNIEKELHTRSNATCELCGAIENLSVFDVPPDSGNSAEQCVLICDTCSEQMANPQKTSNQHWQCLKKSIWSQVPAVQVVAWRILNRLSTEDWSQNLLDTIYLEESTLAWAKSSDANTDLEDVRHIDSNGTVLKSGDTVTITKDLNVKGTGFTAKRGTTVKGIRLVSDDPEQIEGRVNNQQIVILTKFVKKS